MYDQFEIEVWPTDENSKSEDPITEDILQSNTNIIQSELYKIKRKEVTTLL